MVPFSQLPKSSSLLWHQPLFAMAREMIPHRQTLISMEWPQPKSPFQTDNLTATGATNKAIVPCLTKMMDLVAMLPKTNFVITGTWALKTGLTTTLNTNQTPTMKPTKVLMQASGTR
jgi:hypothetical protein